MSKVYYTTTNGERSGRASPAYQDKGHALDRLIEQFDKAESLGLKTVYTVTDGEAEDFVKADLR